MSLVVRSPFLSFNPEEECLGLGGLLELWLVLISLWEHSNVRVWSHEESSNLRFGEEAGQMIVRFKMKADDH